MNSVPDCVAMIEARFPAQEVAKIVGEPIHENCRIFRELPRKQERRHTCSLDAQGAYRARHLGFEGQEGKLAGDVSEDEISSVRPQDAAQETLNMRENCSVLASFVGLHPVKPES